jgi:hypothetical protein
VYLLDVNVPMALAWEGAIQNRLQKDEQTWVEVIPE